VREKRATIQVRGGECSDYSFEPKRGGGVSSRRHPFEKGKGKGKEETGNTSSGRRRNSPGGKEKRKITPFTITRGKAGKRQQVSEHRMDPKNPEKRKMWVIAISQKKRKGGKFPHLGKGGEKKGGGEGGHRDGKKGRGKGS